MREYGISNMELSFTSIGTGYDKTKTEDWDRVGYARYKFIGGFSYMFARSNLTVSLDGYAENLSIRQNIKICLMPLFDMGIIKKYDYCQGIVSLTHYMIADIRTLDMFPAIFNINDVECGTTEMDIKGCREIEDEGRTRFSIIYKFKIGANKKLINHPTPTANISKSLASLHKINILSKGSNLEIKAIFSLNNSSSKGNNKFIKNSLHYRIISDIIDDSINNLLGNND